MVRWPPKITVAMAIGLFALEPGCGDNSNGTDDGGACDPTTCDANCRADGGCLGACDAGCTCTACSADADSDGAEDGGADRAEHEDARDAETITDVETRVGGSAGVNCRRVPTEPGTQVPHADGDGRTIVYSRFVPFPFGPLFAFDWVTGSEQVLDEMEDVISVSGMLNTTQYPAIDSGRVAYGLLDTPTEETTGAQLRFLDLAAGSTRVISTASGGADDAPAVDFVSLDYPWVVWREISADHSFRWAAYAQNLETDARLVLAEESTVGIDLLETTAVASVGGLIAVTDLASGTTRDLCDDGIAQWDGVVTPDWIAWLDQQAFPECDRFSPCGTQVYGLNRTTDEIVPLVASDGMHGPQLDGEGDWLAYTDQRDNADPWQQTVREENIYALYLPTMTEIRVEDWSGYQISPKVYTGVDEMRVLFFEQIGTGAYELWDCNLPTPSGDGG